MPWAKTPDGLTRFAAEKSSTASTTFYSHDWADKTTWTTSAARVVNEVATRTTSTIYTLAHTNVIDTYHGKVTGEDYLLDPQGNSYRVTVTVNSIAKTEQDPHYGTGGDYTVNYEAGTIQFLAPIAPTDTVRVTYHYATNSLYVLAPAPGKKLILSFVEVQFSADIEITDSVVFQPYGLVDVFAPQLMPGIPSGTKIPLGNPLVYKTMNDYQNDAVRAYPKYPALGGTGWRGSPQEILVMDWDYLRGKTLAASAGMEIHLTLAHDTPFNGYYATATFYCAVEDE